VREQHAGPDPAGAVGPARGRGRRRALPLFGRGLVHHRGGAGDRRGPDPLEPRRNVTRVDLNGKVVVITGASAGIGWATAGAFAREGATVVATARREERLKEVVALVEQRGGKAMAVTC